MNGDTPRQVIAVGEIVEIECTVDGSVESLVVVRDAEGLKAWLNICPHAGRRLDYAPGQFLRTRDGLLMCPVHGATFETGTGLCVGGPCAGASLTPVQLDVDADGQIRGASIAPLRTAG